MQPKPVRQATTPDYPQREQMLGEKELLKNRVPRRWRRLGGALGLLVAVNLSGCGASETEVTTASPTQVPGPIAEDVSLWVESLMWAPAHMVFGRPTAFCVPTEEEAAQCIPDQPNKQDE